MNLWTKKYVLLSGLAAICVWRITSGEWDIPLSEVIYFLFNGDSSLPEAIVIRSVRLPRVLCSIGAGGLLSVSGVVLQGLLANPLAEPYTLGIASGAAFGAALGLMSGAFMVMPGAFGGAIGALVLTGLTAKSGGNGKLILAGVISSAVLSAGVTFLKAIAGDRLGAVVLWLMGSFAGADGSDVWAVWTGVVLVFVPAYVLAPVLDAMSLGRDRAAVLGVNEGLVRTILLTCCSLGVALCVSAFGIIGFVGLVVPHMARGIVGAGHRGLTVHAFLMGACLLGLADGVAQRLGELPVGVLTALTGGPFFWWVLARR